MKALILALLLLGGCAAPVYVCKPIEATGNVYMACWPYETLDTK